MGFRLTLDREAGKLADLVGLARTLESLRNTNTIRTSQKAACMTATRGRCATAAQDAAESGIPKGREPRQEPVVGGTRREVRGTETAHPRPVDRATDTQPT